MTTNPVELTVPLPPVLEAVDGTYRVKGTRISLFDIVTAYNERWVGPQAMVFHYPSLSLYQVEKVFEFYHANAAAVDDWVRRWKAEGERIMAALPKGPSRAELLARLEARRREALAPTEAG